MQLFAGMIIFAILVGFITDIVTGFMSSLEEGTTQVAEKNHTLILGWNESTPRVITQLAFVRRAWCKQNETWERRLLPWRRVPPSSPVAAAPIVILCNAGSAQVCLSRISPKL